MTNPGAIARRTFLVQAGAAAAGLAAAPTLARLAASQTSALVRAAASPRPASGWQIGIYTRPWEQFDYRTALDAIAEAGFKHAGLMTAKGRSGLVLTCDSTPEEVGQVAEDLKKRGLAVPSVYGGGIPVHKSLKDGIEGMRRLVDHCAAVGAASILMGGIGDPKLVEPYYKAIAENCDYAAEEGMNVAVKPHGPLNATGPECRKAVEKVGKKNFGVCYDPGNILYYSDGKLDPVQDAATVAGTVKGMCIKDFIAGERDGKPLKDVWVTPGEGKVDFPAVLAALKQGGFTGGALVIECVRRKDPKDLKAILAEAKKAKAFVERLVRSN